MPTYFISAPIDAPNNDDGEVVLVINNARAISKAILNGIIASWAAPRNPAIFHISNAVSSLQTNLQKSRTAQKRNAFGVYVETPDTDILDWNNTHYLSRMGVP